MDGYMGLMVVTAGGKEIQRRDPYGVFLLIQESPQEIFYDTDDVEKQGKALVQVFGYREEMTITPDTKPQDIRRMLDNLWIG